jgi:hypothetical protein
MTILNDVNGSSIDLEKVVEDEVEKQFEIRLNLVLRSITLSAKFLAGAAAVFLALFAILGWQSWKDIKLEAQDVASKRIGELVEKTESDISVAKHLNDLVNRSTVTAALISLKRTDASAKSTFALSPNDWERLRKWTVDESSSVEDFSDALTVLNLQDDKRKQSDANEFLADLLRGQVPSSQWIHKSLDKRKAIMSLFQSYDMGVAAFGTVLDENESDEIRALALDYLVKIDYRQNPMESRCGGVLFLRLQPLIQQTRLSIRGSRN